MPGQPFQGLLPPFSEAELASNLERHVRRLAEEIGPRNFAFYPQLQATADYLQRCLEGFGYQVRRQGFERGGQLFENLETVSGDGPFTVVGAHYDSVYDCPGANDNASGVAALLELARLNKGHRGLRYVLFCNEEPPFFMSEAMGSRQYVAHLMREKQPVTGMVCLETVGYYSSEPGSQRSPLTGLLPTIGDFVAIAGDINSASLARRLVGEWQANVAFPCLGLVPLPELESKFIELGMGWSDHSSFWEEGIPAVIVTDTVFLRYDHYHSRSDTWEKLTYPAFARMVAGLAKVLTSYEHGLALSGS